jgi:histidinol-phosphate aminotransferase
MAFASPEIIAVLNKIKYPYNVSRLTQEYAEQLLHREDEMRKQVETIISERARLSEALSQLPFVERVFPSDANFIFTRVINADATYQYLMCEKVVVRNRHTIALCKECIRITVGTPDENNTLLHVLNN